VNTQVKGFPFDNSERILYLGERNTTRNQRYGPVSYPDLRDWRARVKSFAGLTAANGFRVNLSDQNGLPERYQGVQITANRSSSRLDELRLTCST
jgi:hypothetical protein